MKRFNVVLTRTALELRGVFCLPLLLKPPICKSMMSSMSFGKLVEGIIPGSQRQASLLDPYDRDRVAGLMAALDIVNTTYGPGRLCYGLQGFRNAKWEMRQNLLSTDNSRALQFL